MNYARIAHQMREQPQEDSKYDVIYADLQSMDIDKIKGAITILNTELCMANENMRGLIGPMRFVKPLLTQLDNQFDPTLMVLASNCLLSLIDLVPEVSETIIDAKGLKVLEQKSQSIEYIDVAEDCVKLLDKIAENCPNEVLSSGCALNFLNFIDFFDKSVQETIMDLVKKCVGEFYNLHQWNGLMKPYAAIIVNMASTCASNLQMYLPAANGGNENLGNNDSPWIKPLETLALLISRLSEATNYGDPIENSEDNENDNMGEGTHDRGDYRFTRDRPQSVAEIIDELFEDQSCIINLVNALTVSAIFSESPVVNILSR